LVEQADAGGLLVQEPFPVTEVDYAEDVVEKLLVAMDRAMDRWLPRLIAGEWAPQPQDESKATWTTKRTPADGRIDWNAKAADIHRLVRATSKPHPGAFTECREKKLTVWRAEVENNPTIHAEAGSILDTLAGGQLLVKCGDGQLRLTQTEWEGDAPKQMPKTGDRFQ